MTVARGTPPPRLKIKMKAMISTRRSMTTKSKSSKSVHPS